MRPINLSSTAENADWAKGTLDIQVETGPETWKIVETLAELRPALRADGVSVDESSTLSGSAVTRGQP
jgi:hypothetical protein